MLQLQSHHHRRLLAAGTLQPSQIPIPHSHCLNFHRPPRHNRTATAASSRAPSPWLAEASEPTTSVPVTEGEGSPSEEGPVELPPSSSSIFATSDDPTPLQVATSVLLTGAIGVFLFRSIRRRAKRAKELVLDLPPFFSIFISQLSEFAVGTRALLVLQRLRSAGGKKTSQEEALARLNAINLGSVKAKESPSPVQALLGGIAAGVIAVILYKFTTTIEAALNRQTVSDNFSVRQITITVRTIVNGLCYLATCVFGVNSIGLILYAGQLAISPPTEASASASSGQEQSGSGNKDQSSSTEPNLSDGSNKDSDSTQ